MLSSKISLFSNRVEIKRGVIFGMLIITALLAFELFNYSTTDFALSDLLGDLKFIGISWATILSIAFCGIDFAGIARLFTPEKSAEKPTEVWYLFGAWMLAAVMNALLTWWGVSIAIVNHQTLGNAVVAPETLITVVPIFVAIMVWLIRVLIIGTISMSGDRLFSQSTGNRTRNSQPAEKRSSIRRKGQSRQRSIRPLNNTRTSTGRRSVSASGHQASLRQGDLNASEPEYESKEPTYSPVSFSGNRNNRSRHARF